MKNFLFIGLVCLCLSSCLSFENNEAFNYMSTVNVTGDWGVWQKRFYVDEFKQFTKDAYIKTSLNGVFSNSATNGSELMVNIIGNKNNIEFDLLEYGNYPLSLIGDYNISIKISCNGETIKLGGASYSETTKRLKVYDSLTLMKAFVENSEVIMRIDIDNYGLSSYLFKVNTAGFEYAYHKAFIPEVNPVEE